MFVYVVEYFYNHHRGNELTLIDIFSNFEAAEKCVKTEGLPIIEVRLGIWEEEQYWHYLEDHETGYTITKKKVQDEYK